ACAEQDIDARRADESLRKLTIDSGCAECEMKAAAERTDERGERERACADECAPQEISQPVAMNGPTQRAPRHVFKQTPASPTEHDGRHEHDDELQRIAERAR